MSEQPGMSEFADFVAAQQPRLRAYVGALPGARHAEVDDLLQEALLRAYERRDRFASDEHAVNWICQVVRNLLVDGHRGWLRRQVLPYADLEPADETAADPADVVAVSEQAWLAVRAVGRLPVTQRELLWEHVVDGVSYADIARRTATPLATVRSFAHRARLAAAREFARAGGALAVLPVRVMLSGRRAARRLTPSPELVEGLSIGISVLVATAVAAPVVAAAPAEVRLTDGGSRAASTSAVVRPVPTPRPVPRSAPAAPVAPARSAPAAAHSAPVGTPTPLPAVRTGDFSGTYSSDCTFADDQRATILWSYTCHFSAKSDSCRFTVAGTSETFSGCTVELVDAVTKGTADGYAPLDGVAPGVRDCQSVSFTSGLVRFRTAPDADPIDIAVRVDLNRVTAQISNGSGVPVRFNASFPFLCSAPRQRDQHGFQGTLG